MSFRCRVVWTIVVCIAGLAMASGCRSSSSPAPSATIPGATSSVRGAPNPNATESNPAGDIPDTQAFVAYSAPGNKFTLRVPEGWARTSSGSTVLFSDKYNSLRIEIAAAPTAPTPASAQATELPAVRASAHEFSAGTAQNVHRTAGSTILITYRADSPANPVTGKVAVEAVERYEFWKSGTEVVVTLAAPLGSDNVDPWRKVTDSLSWQP
jgi:hypothetical protein